MRRAASNPGLPLVRWPENSGHFHDTGEGGLYAYAWWPHEDEYDRCVVDTALWAHNTDVTCHVVGPMKEALTMPYDGLSDWKQRNPDKNLGDYYLSSDYARSQMVDAAGAAVYLGSSPCSSFSNHDRDYFRVDWSALTKKGTRLVTAISQIYGEPTFTTHLDT